MQLDPRNDAARRVKLARRALRLIDQEPGLLDHHPDLRRAFERLQASAMADLGRGSMTANRLGWSGRGRRRRLGGGGRAA